MRKKIEDINNEDTALIKLPDGRIVNMKSSNLPENTDMNNEMKFEDESDFPSPME